MSFSDVRAYSPPLSLWQLVEQNVSPEEQEEIRSMLGTSLVETALDLHSEVDMLLEIWRDYQDETEAETPKTNTLAEPPHLRERLIQEICFLAEGVREKSVKRGMNPSDLFTGHNTHILEYAEDVKRTGSSLGMCRPMSARSSDGRQTPLSPSGLATSRSVLCETIHDDVVTAGSKLNYLQFDQVCKKLRETLNKEVEQLETDVQFLQTCLDEAADSRSRATTPALSREPTLTELKEERSLLEKELLSTKTLPITPSVDKPAFLAKPSIAAVKVQSLTPVSTRLRPGHPANTERVPAKTAPLKASHLIHPSSSPELITSTSPVDTSASPDGATSPASHGRNPRVIAQAYDLNLDQAGLDSMQNLDRAHLDAKQSLDQVRVNSKQSLDRGSLATKPSLDPARQDSNQSHRSVAKDNDSCLAEEGIRRRDGSSGSRRRNLSPARVKVVPVGSLMGSHVDVAGGRSFIPTPPTTEKPHLPRPSSAERFRKMVMHHRETT